MASPHTPGITVNAIMPEPIIAPIPSAVSSLSSSASAISAFIVDTALMMISGAAEPNAMKEAPATSSRTFQRTHSVSKLTTRCASAMIATA